MCHCSSLRWPPYGRPPMRLSIINTKSSTANRRPATFRRPTIIRSMAIRRPCHSSTFTVHHIMPKLSWAAAATHTIRPPTATDPAHRLAAIPVRTKDHRPKNITPRTSRHGLAKLTMTASFPNFHRKYKKFPLIYNFLYLKIITHN